MLLVCNFRCTSPAGHPLSWFQVPLPDDGRSLAELIGEAEQSIKLCPVCGGTVEPSGVTNTFGPLEHALKK
ncbi:MAG: hypothetical protein A3J62_02615 [Candidatus Buchananbacteria bacterium RIFCSPHIGHO2_02_FULL_38_8]|uniref:Uncharacterized protein n=2 Tax=Candidatus Buchananiibacteriota TaxID=1817903 RepID=A0A1G1XYD9_9BACT|nr:MAG: hypothetical protein A2731_01320 [Candidatus Buchananbacteria bacterium RIFCSPHIGHO2_01_FULL_39_8]OGY47283.1 MAG: hypothetical protein A3J62_02615 [Candidatus Buchananbacteria bacterium RIFCSPHIGHO2_02_FULL_38_8]